MNKHPFKMISWVTEFLVQTDWIQIWMCVGRYKGSYSFEGKWEFLWDCETDDKVCKGWFQSRVDRCQLLQTCLQSAKWYCCAAADNPYGGDDKCESSSMSTMQRLWEGEEQTEGLAPQKTLRTHENKSDFLLACFQIQHGIAAIWSDRIQMFHDCSSPLQNVKSALQKVQQKWVHQGFFFHCIRPTLFANTFPTLQSFRKHFSYLISRGMDCAYFV